jgi:hypothetical protein
MAYKISTTITTMTSLGGGERRVPDDRRFV